MERSVLTVRFWFGVWGFGERLGFGGWGRGGDLGVRGRVAPPLVGEVEQNRRLPSSHELPLTT